MTHPIDNLRGLKIALSAFGLILFMTGLFGTWASAPVGMDGKNTVLIRPSESAFQDEYEVYSKMAISNDDKVTWPRVGLVQTTGLLGILGFATLVLLLVKKEKHTSFAPLRRSGKHVCFLVHGSGWSHRTIQNASIEYGRFFFGAGGLMGLSLLTIELWPSRDDASRTSSA